MGQVIIANLPTTEIIDANSYIIVERPKFGAGTFKSTVGDLQRAITVKAKVEQVGNVTHISIDDINGHTDGQIVAPTAAIRDNGDNTLTITIQDGSGVTEETILRDSRATDSIPTEGSNNIVTSGTVYELQKSIEDRLSQLEQSTDSQLEAFEVLLNSKVEEFENEVKSYTDRIKLIESIVQILYYTRLCDETDQIIVTEQDDELMIPIFGTIGSMRADGGEPGGPFNVDGTAYLTLSEAILDAVERRSTITLLGDAYNTGVLIPENSELTLDLNGHSLYIVGPGVSSEGSGTTGMYLSKDSDVVIKNGHLVFDDNRLENGIQNFSNLIVDNTTVTGGPTINYTISNKCGDTTFRNNARIVAEEGKVAFDCYYGSEETYDSGVTVTIDDSTVTVQGKVEFGKADRASREKFAYDSRITCPENMNLTVLTLTSDCDWHYNKDETKTMRYWPIDWVELQTESAETITNQQEEAILAPVHGF